MATVSITATGVLASSSAQIVQAKLGVGVTVTQGQVLYALSDGLTYGLADSNGTTPANSFAGIALNAGSPGQIINMAVSDPSFTLGATVASGTVLYVSSTTPGAIEDAFSGLASGSTTITLGVMNTGGTTMNLRALTGGVK